MSKYPYLFAELLSDPRWTDADLKKLAGLNVIRVLREAERVRREERVKGLKKLEREERVKETNRRKGLEKLEREERVKKTV